MEEGGVDQFQSKGKAEHGLGADIEFFEFEMGFPSFENEFDAPTQTVDVQEFGSRPHRGADVGDEDIPAEEEKAFLVGMAVVGWLGAGLTAVLVGYGIGDGQSHQTDGESLLLSEANIHVQRALAGKEFSQADGFALWIVETNPVTVAREEENARVGHLSETVDDKTTKVSENQISTPGHGQDVGSGGLVIASETGDGQMGDGSLEKITDKLEFELGKTARGLIGATREGRGKAVGQRDGGAVLEPDTTKGLEHALGVDRSAQRLEKLRNDPKKKPLDAAVDPLLNGLLGIGCADEQSQHRCNPLQAWR